MPQRDNAITALNDLRYYLLEQHLRFEDLDDYMHAVGFFHRLFNVDEAIDVVLKIFNNMNKTDRHQHAPAFTTTVKSLVNIRK